MGSKNLVRIEIEWNYSDPPKDRIILRYHALWKCIIAVYWKPGLAEGCPWVTATKSVAWPEDAFSDGWSESFNPHKTGESNE